MSRIHMRKSLVYYIVKVDEETAKTGKKLSMIVTDGNVRRLAFYETESNEQKKCLEGTFKKLYCYIDDSENLIVESIDEADYSRIDIQNFFPYSEIPLEVLNEWFKCVVEHMRNDLLPICKNIAYQFLLFTDGGSICPITEAENHKRYECVLSVYQKIRYYGEMIYKLSDSNEDVIFAGLFIASFENFFLAKSNPLAVQKLSVEFLMKEVEYFGEISGVDKELLKKLQNVVYIFCTEDEDRLTKRIIYELFFE